MPTEHIPDPAELLVDLRTIARTGLAVSRLKDLPTLFGLAIVATEARGNRPLDRAIALEGVIREAVEALGEGPTGEAVQLLLGLTPAVVGCCSRSGGIWPPSTSASIPRRSARGGRTRSSPS